MDACPANGARAPLLLWPSTSRVTGRSPRLRSSMEDEHLGPYARAGRTLSITLSCAAAGRRASVKHKRRGTRRMIHGRIILAPQSIDPERLLGYTRSNYANVGNRADAWRRGADGQYGSPAGSGTEPSDWRRLRHRGFVFH